MLMSPHGQVNNYRSQHTYVKKVLDQMLPPMLPALFRIFMSGIIPPLRGVPQRTKRFPAPAVAARQIEAEQQVLAQETSANGEKSSGGRETISAAVGRNMLGTQWGPWFFAPYLTSVVSPLFLTFLIGPCRFLLKFAFASYRSFFYFYFYFMNIFTAYHLICVSHRPNRRKDGQRGGMMVEKCKFLQVFYLFILFRF